MARPLSGLFDVELEAKVTASGTISTRPGKTGPAFSLIQSRHKPVSVRPFFLTQGLPRHQKCLEEIPRVHCLVRLAGAKRAARRASLWDDTALGPVAGIAVIRNRFYDLHAAMATPVSVPLM
jgi:hypothetical protein